MNELEMFKTTLMRGYDKEEVHEYMQRVKDETTSMQTKHRKEMEEKDAKIVELMARLEKKDAQQEEIRVQYQKYVDNYESISRLVFDAQIKADAMIKEAEEKAAQIVAEAEAEAKQRVEAVQHEVDEKMAEGKKKYIAVQEEMNEIVELINQAQRRFMASYKEVHQIISTMPASLHDLEIEGEELPEPEVEEELHLGDTQELAILDSLETMEALDEYDMDDESDEALANQIEKYLEEE